MLALASKYTNVRAAVQTPGPPPPHSLSPGERVGVRAAPQVPTNILIRKLAKRWCLREWLWKSLKEGGATFEYLRREKLRSAERQRAVARQMDGFQQNNRSDWQLRAAVPAREFFRWQATDDHFWDDNKNLKSLKRDNPDLPIFV